MSSRPILSSFALKFLSPLTTLVKSAPFSRVLGSRRLLAFAMFALIAMSAAMPSAFAQRPADKNLDRAGNVVHKVVGSALGSVADIAKMHDNGHDHSNNDDDNRTDRHDDERDDDGSRHSGGRNSSNSDDDDNGGGNDDRGRRGNNDDDDDNNNDDRDRDSSTNNSSSGNGSNDGSGSSSGNDGDRCNCIVMRLDDVQDEWVRDVQLALLNRLISNHVHTSTAIIMKDFGNDSAIVSKVREGGDAGLFEYSIHGWDHVDYATLSLEEQKSTLEKAKAKLVDVLGKDSDIFVTPYNNFSENTLSAMDQLGMTIISSDETDLFPAAPKESPLYPNIAHMPQTINFAEQVGEVKVLRPLNEIVSAVSADIRDKGYAVLTLHPQDFTQYKGTEVQNEVNPVAMLRLEQFIKSARDAGFSFAGFEQALEDNHPDLSTIPDKSKPYESVLTPSPGSSFSVNSEVTVTGRAFDDTAIKSVEVRTTDSSYRAASTDNNFEDWTETVQMPSAPGTVDIIAKATDIEGKQTWVYVPVNVTQ
jgi:peptidoglycan/xylan/chitin deacetylase (PgdA/CDA1 family)